MELDNNEVSNHNKVNVFRDIWFRPKQVFQYILEFDYNDFVIPLLYILGILRSLNSAIDKNLGDMFSLPTIIFSSIFIGGFFGWLGFYIYAIILRWTGKWLNGKGDTDSILKVLAYGQIPSILVLLLIIAQIFLFGEDLFKSEMDPNKYNTLNANFLIITTILQVLLVIWSSILVIIGLSEVQKFSIGKSILNFLLPVIIIVVPIIFILILIT